MSDLKTKETNISIEEYLQAIADETRREDSKIILSILEEITKEKPKVWSGGMVGFGKYTYHRKGSKKELEFFKMGFAARKTRLSLYLTCDLTKYDQLISKLGKCKTGKGCLHFNRLTDIDLSILKQLIQTAHITENYSTQS